MRGHASPFALVDEPRAPELESEGRVRYLLVNGPQDDALWGPIGAVWLSQDGRRGGCVVHPFALWEGSELVRGFRSALARGWTTEQVYAYWRTEVWPRGHVVEDEREASSLALLSDLVSAL